ncbi:hypothetical protein [Salicola sp. Rm-C-2C1-2]|uniref:hypothetical protein n=1 Tax=Salicola sp. Rm-C-2C1-2 TaxID=3141321 RepID=UPI0032E41ADC
MKTVSKRQEKIFDGQYEEMERKPPEIEVDGVEVTVRPGELKSIENIQQGTTTYRPEDVSAMLGLKVGSFDGVNIYKGSKPGLELHYQCVGDRILVFSFGEFQPDRFVCRLEAVLD